MEDLEDGHLYKTCIYKIRCESRRGLLGKKRGLNRNERTRECGGDVLNPLHVCMKLSKKQTNKKTETKIFLGMTHMFLVS